MELSGKIAVVTGASRGIGAATAQALGREGAQVVLMARGSDDLSAQADAIRAAGGEAHAIAADLGTNDDVERAAQEVLGEIGVPDAIVNNAGAGRFLFIDETDPEEAVQQMAVPYFAAFFVTRAFIEPMLERGSGTILMVGTPASILPWPGAIGYASARAAVRGFTMALRQDLRGTGLQVSSVTPAKVSSGYFEHNPGAEERIPTIGALLGKQTPEQVGKSIVDALKRDRGDINTPWQWALAAPLARAIPGPFLWLSAKTGAKRP